MTSKNGGNSSLNPAHDHSRKRFEAPDSEAISEDATPTPSDLRDLAARLDQRSAIHHAESLDLYRRAADMNEEADRLNLQARDMFAMSEISGSEIEFLHSEAKRLRNEAETLIVKVFHLYQEASQIHIESNRLHGAVTAVHGNAADLLSESTSLHGSVNALRDEVTRLYAKASTLIGEVSRLSIDAHSLQQLGLLSHEKANAKYMEASVLDWESDERFGDVKHWQLEAHRLHFQANQATAEAQFLREQSEVGHEKAAELGDEANQLRRDAASTENLDTSHRSE